MKKILSIIIVVALLATQFIFPAFAETDTIEKVTVTAQEDLIAFYSGSQEIIDDKEVFVYDVTEADLWFDIEFANGETFSGDMWEVSAFLDAGFSYDNIVCEGDNHVGTYDVEINCEYFVATAKVNIVENPLESIEAVATVPLCENWDGQWVEYCEDEECDKYFEYDVYYSEPYFKITYKDGTVYEGNDEEIEAQTGFYTYTVETQAEKHWTVGKNIAKVSFLGVECEFEVEVVETPVESVEVETIFPLYENYSGYLETIINENGEEEQYFEYNVMDSVPYFTVKFKNGDIVEGTADEIQDQCGEEFILVKDQHLNPWAVGENTANAVFLGYDFSFTVEVIKDTVVSITGEPMTYLIENYHGNWENYYDENDNETEYFWYDIYAAEPVFTITYEDGSTITGTDEEIYLQTGVWTYDETEQFSNPWIVGENTAKMSYLGHEFDVVYVVQESPVESVNLTEENGLTIEIKYKDDETVNKFKAIDFVTELVGYEIKSYIVTENGKLECDVYANSDGEGTEEFYISVLGVESNKLDNCDWIEATIWANEIAYYSLIYATGSEELFGKNFTGFNSSDEEQDLTQMVALATYLCEYDPEEAESYYYHNLDTDTINEDLALVFGITLEDFTAVDGYNEETGTVEIYEPIESAYEFETLDMNLVEGKWEKIYRVVEIETGKVDVLKVVVNSDGTVDKLVFNMFGDTNGDGKVTAFDARQTLQVVAELKEFSEAQALAADVNCDGKLSAIDARWILQVVAQLREF